MKKRVGIFGGTFDPVHTGHVALARSFLESRLIDRLLVTLTPEAPHKQGREKTSYDDRLAMLNLAFEEIENAEVSTLEQRLPSPSYTLQTLEYLQNSHPETVFYLCMGEDSLVQFHKWYKYKEILKRTDLIVAERPGYDWRETSDEIRESVILIEHRPVEVSATEIRSEIQEKSSVESQQVPEGVQRYIREKGLYR